MSADLEIASHSGPIFWDTVSAAWDCGRFLGPLRGPSQRGAELGRRAAAERIAAPLRIVAADPGPELLDEAGGGPARPVPAVPELPLEQAEEALHRGVVRAAALGGHAPGEVVVLADRDPAGPAVVAAAVGVDDGALAGRQPGAVLALI